MKAVAAAMVLLLAGMPTMHALVIDGGLGTANATNPGTGVPWANIGQVGSASGIYLGAYGGNYWVLTAAHVGLANLTLGATTYSAVSGSSVRVLNGDNSNTDLLLFRISTDPGLPSLSLASTAPANGSTVTMIGSGRVESGPVNYWQVTVNPGPSNDVWTNLGTNPSGANAAGFNQGASIGQRWGTNTITGSQSYDVGTGTTAALYSTFGGADAQGATGDSGGASFYHDGSSWLLMGMLGAIGLFENQPTDTAISGNITYFADISTYRGFIVSAIPEPSTWAMWAGLAALGCVAALRRRQ